MNPDLDLTLERVIRAPRAAVWQAWTDPAKFAKWWLPDRFEFVEEIPKTSVGKFKKTELREQFAHEQVPASS